jgi:ABC-type ATPase involved in cell division
VVFQDHKLLHDRPVADNVALPLIIAGVPRREIDKRVRAALDQVGLLGKEKSRRSNSRPASSSASASRAPSSPSRRC